MTSWSFTRCVFRLSFTILPFPSSRGNLDRSWGMILEDSTGDASSKAKFLEESFGATSFSPRGRFLHVSPATSRGLGVNYKGTWWLAERNSITLEKQADPAAVTNEMAPTQPPVVHFFHGFYRFKPLLSRSAKRTNARMSEKNSR